MANPQIVLGGGIAGLSAAYYLIKYSKHPVKLLEASSRFGGWIQSITNPSGTMFELGPRTMRLAPVSGITLEMVEDLGLEKYVQSIPKTHPAVQNRMLLVDGKLHPLPNKLSSLFKKVSPFKEPLAYAFLNDLKATPKHLEDDSVHNFVSRRLGEDIAEYAASSLVAGICAGDSKEISVNLIMSNLFEWEQQHGGITKGLIKSFFEKKPACVGHDCYLAQKAVEEKWSIWSLKGGLQKLPYSLGDYLSRDSRVTILMESPCEGITFTPTGPEVYLKGERIRAEHVYSALPAYELAKLLPDSHQELKDELSQIPTASVGVVNLEYSGKVHSIEGFGFLVPPNQGLPILGVTFDSCCFPQGDKTVLTVMMGGAWFSKFFGDDPDPEFLKQVAIKEVKKALGITAEATDTKVSILRNCIPQYIVGHKARVERIRSYINKHNLPLSLIGCSYDGLGVNDVIATSRKAIQQRLNS